MAIDTFPEDRDLVQTFGSEPSVAYANEKWSDNNITFTFKRNDDSVSCDIMSMHNRVVFIWYKGSQRVLEFDLSSITEIAAIKGVNRSVFKVISAYENLRISVWVDLQPEIAVKWSSDIIPDKS